MKHVQIRIENELYNKLEVFLKIEGLSKQEFLISCIEKAINREDKKSFTDTEMEFENISDKVNLLLENQLVVNDLLSMMTGGSDA